VLRISKIVHAWRWFLEDYDGRWPERVMGHSTEEYGTWQEAEAAARAAHPEVIEVKRHVVRGHGTDYEDSL
jgi:hypothetical protein